MQYFHSLDQIFMPSLSMGINSWRSPGLRGHHSHIPLLSPRLTSLDLSQHVPPDLNHCVIVFNGLQMYIISSELNKALMGRYLAFLVSQPCTVRLSVQRLATVDSLWVRMVSVDTFFSPSRLLEMRAIKVLENYPGSDEKDLEA